MSQLAISRLPADAQLARERRFKRAIDLSFKHEEMPEAEKVCAGFVPRAHPAPPRTSLSLWRVPVSVQCGGGGHQTHLPKPPRLTPSLVPVRGLARPARWCPSPCCAAVPGA